MIRRVLTVVGTEMRALGAMATHGTPTVLLQFLGGLGDELLLTCVARETRKRNPRARIWQISAAADLLEKNPDYTLVRGPVDWRLRHSNLLSPWRRRLSYADEPDPGRRSTPPKEHVLAILCRSAGVRGAIDLRPYCHLLPEETKAGRIAPLQLVVQSVGDKTHGTWMANKLWRHDRLADVVTAVRQKNPEVVWIQLGAPGDRLLPDVVDLRGRTTLRQSAATLSQSACFVGTSGFLVHLARAVECRSVVVYGGREHAWQSGYSCNVNVESHPACAPCWRWSDCDFERECMEKIDSGTVVQAVQSAIERRNEPLSIDRVTVS